MIRRSVVMVVLAGLLTGCLGDAGQSQDPGLLAAGSLEKTARRANFPVRLPAPLQEQKLLNVAWVTAAGGSIGQLSFDLIAPGGSIVTVDQAADATSGLLRSLVVDATPLGSRQIGAERWKAYRAPLLAGLLLVHHDESGVETAVFGNASLTTLTTVAASLR